MTPGLDSGVVQSADEPRLKLNAVISVGARNLLSGSIDNSNDPASPSILREMGANASEQSKCVTSYRRKYHPKVGTSKINWGF
jgi:hypothetical protein